MNKIRLSNPVRLIAFFLTAILLIVSFGFTVDGWQAVERPGGTPPVSMTPPTDDPVGEDEGKNPDNDGNLPEEPKPIFYNRLSGLECSEELSLKAHLAFIMNPSLDSYGASEADLICSFPTENGQERWCVFISETKNLWKIGSITPTRGYISNIVEYFGGICVSNGVDDKLEYNSCSISKKHFDLSGGDYKYSEFVSNVYTNRDLIEAGLADSDIDTSISDKTVLPFDFNAPSNEKIVFESKADCITVTSSTEVNELRYNAELGKYELYKNSSSVTDKIGNKTLNFENCFVLFADSVTYDNSEYSQTVVDTIGGGRGYYFTNGTYTKISWTGSKEGVMTFYTTDGQRLSVNPGKSFISFLKASTEKNLIIG